jgi:mono/diheme cytochrome c family protein
MMKHSLKLAVLLATAMTVAPAALAQGPGATIYQAKCQMCHGPDGKAATPMAKMMGVPSFDIPSSKKATTAALEAAVENGKGKMPAYKGQLNSKQITQVVAYIRELQKK